MIYYNMSIMEVMEFSDWITQKFLDWRANRIGRSTSIAAFGRMFGASHQLMSQWMEKGGKVPNSTKFINALVREYGPEVYEVLGLELPGDKLSALPPGMRAAVEAALSEIRSSFPNSGTDNATPEEVEKINSILLKHLGKFQDTDTD